MSVKDFNSSERVACRILTVDPATRRVEGSIKDGAVIQIRVREIPSLFRWPAVGEVWAVQRKNFDWELVARFEQSQDGKGHIENIPEGVTQIHGSQIKMGDGRDVVVTDESLAANGDAPIWNASQKVWIPGPVGGSQFCSVYLHGNSGAAAYRVLLNSTINDIDPVPFDAVKVNVGGFVLTPEGKITIPTDGWYQFGLSGEIAYNPDRTPVEAAGTVQRLSRLEFDVIGDNGGTPGGDRTIVTYQKEHLAQYNGASWIDLNFTHDWIEMVGEPAYCKAGDTVYLSILVDGLTTSGLALEVFSGDRTGSDFKGGDMAFNMWVRSCE